MGNVYPFMRRAAARRREAMESEIELLLDRVSILLARMDRSDGDCDLEDDDPAGDPLDEHGEHLTDDGTDMLPTLPIYGIDQSRGPVNERRAYAAYLRSLHAGA